MIWFIFVRFGSNWKYTFWDYPTFKDDEEDNDPHFDDFEIDPYERRTKLFVNYLPQELTDEEFNTLFMEDGPIKECFIFRDRITQYSYG